MLPLFNVSIYHNELMIENSILFRYTCTYTDSYQNKRVFAWNTTVSDECCLHCNGTVFKPDSLVNTVKMEDDCKTIESSYCRILPSKYFSPTFITYVVLGFSEH